MSAKDIAFRLAAITTLRDLLSTEIETIRKNEMAPALLAHYNDTGGDRLHITLPGEKAKLAAVTMKIPKPAEATVDINPARFLAWVQQNNPGEVVPTVRASYAKVVAERLVVDGDDVIDPLSGEVVEYATAREAGPDPEPTGEFTLLFEGGTGGLGRETFKAAWQQQGADLAQVSTVLAIGPGESA